MKSIKLFDFEWVSTLLLFGLSPIIGFNFLCLICFIIKRDSFKYPIFINKILLCVLFLFVTLSVLLLLIKQEKLILENNAIIFEKQNIKMNQIKSIKYVNMNIFLLPILYFYKNGGGMVMTIKYTDDKKYNKEVNFRITKKQLELISSMLPQNLEIRFE